MNARGSERAPALSIQGPGSSAALKTDFVAAIAAVRCLALALVGEALLSEGCELDLRIPDAESDEVVDGGAGAAIAESEVVL